MLDKATSSLNNKLEIAVQKALRDLMKGRTTFIIALCLSIVVGQIKLYLLKKDPLPARKTHVILDYSY